ncbi:MAG TPA: hypothetical protein VKV03_19605 [Candidatus Binataceae bacterium]|nr:hypothetical protein [Candidatus Binataceae bacterium]
MKVAISIVIVFAAQLLPGIAAACPACFAASGARTISAYYASTMLLSLMPFALLGGVVLAAYLMRNRPAGVEDR